VERMAIEDDISDMAKEVRTMSPDDLRNLWVQWSVLLINVMSSLILLMISWQDSSLKENLATLISITKDLIGLVLIKMFTDSQARKDSQKLSLNNFYITISASITSFQLCSVMSGSEELSSYTYVCIVSGFLVLSHSISHPHILTKEQQTELKTTDACDVETAIESHVQVANPLTCMQSSLSKDFWTSKQDYIESKLYSSNLIYVSKQQEANGVAGDDQASNSFKHIVEQHGRDSINDSLRREDFSNSGTRSIISNASLYITSVKIDYKIHLRAAAASFANALIQFSDSNREEISVDGIVAFMIVESCSTKDLRVIVNKVFLVATMSVEEAVSMLVRKSTSELFAVIDIHRDRAITNLQGNSSSLDASTLIIKPGRYFEVSQVNNDVCCMKVV